MLRAHNLIDDHIPHFLLSDVTPSPSLFWGQSLLSLYYLVTSHAYFNASLGEPWGKDKTYSAFINLTQNSTASVGDPGEVPSDEFFHIYCITEANLCQNSTIPLFSQRGGTGAGNFESPYPTIWPTVNILGKAMWFTVMMDLGQTNITVPNMLADADLLANLTSNVTNEANAWLELQNSTATCGSTLTLDTRLAYKNFDPSITPAPALGADPSYFSTTYICQKAVLKPLGTRLIAILSSSLILLHTIWNIFWLVFNWIVLGRLREEVSQDIVVYMADNTNSESLELVEQEANNYTQVNPIERLLD
ncbi:hypothetical protein F5Y19DRAFT_487029 [Xylariaceae sp. FL1651]|nr:hypothetical protein F5Y19DRAFT_487029 [Xylariaceae sp. FL1651]